MESFPSQKISKELYGITPDQLRNMDLQEVLVKLIQYTIDRFDEIDDQLSDLDDKFDRIKITY